MWREDTRSGWARVLGLVASVLLTATSLLATDVWDLATPPDDTAAAARNLLIPGDPPQRHDVQTKAGPVADEDWFLLPVVAGHSYEVRVGARQEDCFDFGAAPGNVANFQVLEADGTTPITTGLDVGLPIITSYRATFVRANNTHILVRLIGKDLMGNANCGANSEYTIQAWDTTLLSPVWSTFGGFETFYRFLNASNQTVHGTLTLLDATGTNVIATQPFTILAGETTATVFTGPVAQGGLGVADNQAGQARFSHDGPVGAILIDGFLGIFGASTSTIPIKFDRALKGD